MLPTEEVCGQSAIPSAQKISGNETPRDSLPSASSLEKYFFQLSIFVWLASSEI
jgi:hypothetical protein